MNMGEREGITGGDESMWAISLGQTGQTGFSQGAGSARNSRSSENFVGSSDELRIFREYVESSYELRIFRARNNSRPNRSELPVGSSDLRSELASKLFQNMFP
jgi:hypothetical protein